MPTYQIIDENDVDYYKKLNYVVYCWLIRGIKKYFKKTSRHPIKSVVITNPNEFFEK